MNTFQYHNPTRLIFGKGQVNVLGKEIREFGKRVLLVYGGGSIKRSGLFERIVNQLNEGGMAYFECPDVEPNPRITSVERGIKICKENAIDVVLAVGGGSVIDCAKAIAVGAKYDGDAWDMIKFRKSGEGALPLVTVLTLAATGSEMNSGAVITNWEKGEKLGWGHPLAFPKLSILDPQLTLTVPKEHTIYGIVDIMSHALEQYFNQATNRPLQDCFTESLLRTMVEIGPKLVDDLGNIDLRETMLYCGTMALNGTLSMGVRGDWATHMLEHVVSAVYDIPHGGGLAILFPQWMRVVLEREPHMRSRLVQLGKTVFGLEMLEDELETAKKVIATLEEFWRQLGAPRQLADYKINDAGIEELVSKADEFKAAGNYYVLSKEDKREIYTLAL